MLFPYRDLPSNNRKTENLIYYDDALWADWGSLMPGFLPTPKPDLCVSFKRTAFTRLELQRLKKSPYPDQRGRSPSFTLEFKTALIGSEVREYPSLNAACCALVFRKISVGIPRFMGYILRIGDYLRVK